MSEFDKEDVEMFEKMSGDPMDIWRKEYPNAMVHVLPPIPMKGDMCANPYSYDALRVGQGLTENGRFEIMYLTSSRLEEGEWKSPYRDEDLVIIDRRTGNRVRINLTKMFPYKTGG